MTNSSDNFRCLALSGGVGGAKLALGLSKVLSPDQLTVIANTGDDFDHLGFHICPDLDTVMYTLADLSNKDVGWGQEGETWHFLEALQRFEEETWFKLGDRDLATHVARTVKLGQGRTLSEVTRELCHGLSIDHPIIPMSDDTISTVVHTDSETLSFQHYFVRDRCEPVVTGFDFEGIEDAKPSPGFEQALDDPNLGLIVICPSNPFVSVDPILLVPGVKERIAERKVPMVAVSPIVSGLAIKGPAAKMMKELGMPQSATAVAEHYVAKYGEILTGFIIDEQDRELATSAQSLGLETIVTNTVMVTLQDRINLANESLKFAKGK
ncbi:MAG TPA: 2-phospho-L-lactate transferase [Gammaproteobacteria bacterium]|nr:2-phospho-L-lactate transferase [Gammaproteobacteria bacterium]|tara:strand:- start:1835 stop:2806 length:972 start_codon:yes stop_codon:yes gene_type:complete